MGELEADTTLESDYIFYLHVLGRFDDKRVQKLTEYVRRRQLDDGGWDDLPTLPERGWAGAIDNSFLEREAPVTIVWPAPMPTYDVRAQRDLGETAKVEAVLDPWSPIVLTRSPKPIPELRVDVPFQNILRSYDFI